ncbi:hypothetical protein AYR62_11195 [Secundilactobacillus paracollinoides]|uniref:Cupin type-2 domain-containing protein n=1 Tax=Secundilactobacillus paracollinoides TaxID=240427 RepID=A0A1B2IXZ2_9LACO|nr:cupin domain-containing protein [Secundilactobacillus paracollinoides]ANZ64593.1 hypothetical protein AYR62_11195 [Secundilactobacillus paracollinoides]ANZ66903.1 hypothetical protein AYR63_07010 [Secundilactobacillus paracollinoides]KRL76951.1 cupin superfamily protein [Secundilactobacillus paracollinoides DSM 15502 = JCM 11969]
MAQVENNIFGIGEKNTAFGQYFTGLTYRHPLVKKSTTIKAGVSNITFTPAARTNWHIHNNGYQILLVTSGNGWYQETEKPAQKLQAGDHIVIHEGVKHWHGATENSWFSHISITSGTSEWLEPVSDEDYENLNH